MKLSIISTVTIAALSAPCHAKLRGLNSGCAGLPTGYQKCSADQSSFITCNNAFETSQPIAPGTKCCDDVVNVGKIFMVFSDKMCYEPCSGGQEGQQICVPDQPDKYFTCTNGAVPGSLTATLMPMAPGTTCCASTSDSTKIQAC